MATPINRGTSGVVLPKEVSTEIWGATVESSAVMALSPQVALPGSGVTTQTITGEPTAQWVNEAAAKPVSNATVGSKVMTPYKLAVIETFSMEFMRDADALYAELVNRLPAALGRKFDETVFHGTAPGSGFDVLSGSAEVVLDATDTYGDLVNVDAAIAAANGTLNGWALSPAARGVLLRAKDADGRPLLLNDIQRESGVNSLLGAPVSLNRSVFAEDAEGDTLGFAGDWTSARFGTVEGIQVGTSDQTVVDGVSMWQTNQFAVRAEIEVGFIVKNGAHFVKVVGV